MGISENLFKSKINKTRLTNFISFSSPFILISVLDFFILNRGQFDFFSAETIALFFSSGLTFFYQDFFSIDNAINHHPQNINTLLTIFFLIFNNLSFKSFLNYLNLIFYFNLLYLILISILFVFLNNEIKLTNLKIFVLSFITACFPGTLFLSMFAPSGYLSYGISILPIVLNLYILMNYKSFSQISIKLSLIMLGFFLSISYVQIIVIISALIILFLNFLKNKKPHEFHKFNNHFNLAEKFSFYTLLASLTYFVIRSLLFIFSIFIGYEGNYFYYFIGEFNILLCGAIFSLCFLYLFEKYASFFYPFKYFIYPFSLGWLIGANFFAFGWFRSFFITIFMGGSLTQSFDNYNSLEILESIKLFFSLSIVNYFIIISFILSIFLFFKKKNDKSSYIFIILSIFLNLILIKGNLSIQAPIDQYNFNRLFQVSNIALTLLIFLKLIKINSRLFIFTFFIFPILSYLEYFNIAFEIKETKSIKQKADYIIDELYHENKRIICYSTFLPDRCNYASSIFLANAKTTKNIIDNEENIINPQSLTNFSFRKGDILVSGEESNIQGESLFFWERKKGRLNLKPYIEIKEIE